MNASLRALLLGAMSGLCGCATTGCQVPAAPSPPEPSARLVCDRDYRPAVEALVAAATDRVSVTQWELFAGEQTDAMVDALGAAAARGVRVRVLLDDEIEDNAAGAARLVALGVDARLDGLPDTKMHAKSFVADGTTALVGSTNWSDSSIAYNHECNLLLTGGPPAAFVDLWFEGVWEDAGQRGIPEVDQSGSPRLKALADGALLPSLLDAIEGAQREVSFTMYATALQPTNPGAPAMQVFAALMDAAGRGVPVRGVAEWSDWQEDNNRRNEEAVDWLEAGGVDMRWERADVITHAKTFLVDDWIQVQSANLSSSGFSYNHEVGAATDLAEPVADYRVWFDALWSTSTDAPGAAR